MTSASVSETKAKLSALLARVREGETVTITDRGRPVAQLVPIAGTDAESEDARIERLVRAGVLMRPKEKLDVEEFLAKPRPKIKGSLVEALLQERYETER